MIELHRSDPIMPFSIIKRSSEIVCDFYLHIGKEQQTLNEPLAKNKRQKPRQEMQQLLQLLGSAAVGLEPLAPSLTLQIQFFYFPTESDHKG